VQFISADGKESQPFYFDKHNPHECSQTWQVLRSDFDAMMLDHAREHGVDVRSGARVLEVRMDGERAEGVTVKDADGMTHEPHCDVVVDATGQSSLIAQRLKLRVPDAVLRKGSVWTYYRGAYRDAGRDEGATIIARTQDRQGWFWYIPLHDDLVSVGIVTDFEELFTPGASHEAIFAAQVKRCPSIERRLSSGTRANAYFATKDYSYTARQFAGDGWVLVGDAMGFLDPLYSSGVFLALKSGELAADAITAALAAGDTSAARLATWEPTIRQGYDRMRQLVCAFYEGFSFAKFLRQHPRYSGHVISMLIGDIFKDELDEMFEPMRAMRHEMTAPSPED
jgi:flavin-dependent dehydrogenase